MPHEHEHAVVVRAAVGDAAQRGDQRDVVARIGRRLAGDSARCARPARRRARRRRCPNRRRAREARSCALACRALASAFSMNVGCGSSASRDAELRLRRPRRIRAARAGGETRAACRRCSTPGRGERMRDHARRAPRAAPRAVARSPARPASAARRTRCARTACASAVPCTSTKPPAPDHHDVHVGVASRILGVIEVEQRLAVDYADRHRGDAIAQRLARQGAARPAPRDARRRARRTRR